MSYSLYLALALVVTGCASAGSSLESDAGNGGGGRVDGGGGGNLNDAPISNIDAAPPIDAPLPIDAPPGCNPMTTNLLVNGNFDTAPLGMGWTSTPIDATYPIITPDSDTEDTAPNSAWMAGFAQTGATDTLYQDVMIPVGTTILALSGKYRIQSEEFPIFPFDFADIELTTTTGQVLTPIMTLDNVDVVSAWTVMGYNFTNAYAGMTVRLRITTDSDDTNVTNFFFDSLVLNATKCI